MYFIERLKKDKEIISNIENKKERYIYVWDYYKVPIICCVLAVVVIITSIISSIGKQPKIMHVLLLNNDSSIVQVDESIFINTLEKGDVDVENKMVDIIAYLNMDSEDGQQKAESIQVINALLTINEVDVFVSFKDQFDYFAQNDAFCDLSVLLDQTLLTKYQDDLYIFNDSNGNEIVGGIILHSDSLLHKAGYYHNDVIIGAITNGNNLENALVFITQLFND